MASYDQIQQMGLKMVADKAPPTTGADTITSSNLLKNMFPEGDDRRAEVEKIQKTEAKYILAGISALTSGPNRGVLAELLGGSGFQQAVVAGQLIKDMDAKQVYETTLRNALATNVRDDLGFERNDARAAALNRLIKRP